VLFRSWVLTSPTSGIRSVGIVRLRTETPELGKRCGEVVMMEPPVQ
jgi:hypothetical protein